MTYLELFMACETVDDIVTKARAEALVAIIFGNPDRLHAIEEAANEAVQAKEQKND